MVKRKNEKIIKEGKIEKALSWVEAGLQVAGAFVPFIAVAGVGVGLKAMSTTLHIENDC